jgi:hypothetical protein
MGHVHPTDEETCGNLGQNRGRKGNRDHEEPREVHGEKVEGPTVSYAEIGSNQDPPGMSWGLPMLPPIEQQDRSKHLCVTAIQEQSLG